MAINNVVQRGGKVCAYDENGEELFSKSGELVRYTSSSVYARWGNKVCKLDAYDYVMNPDVKDEGGDWIWGVLFVVVVGVFAAYCSSDRNKPATQEQSNKGYDKQRISSTMRWSSSHSEATNKL
ncbi:hypothetical protein [Helicobacter vulpis]|uniref:hypothetical protein n=1 Tax=Helicobacter vulpis TaxID=2316076 RepID=UPI000EB51AF3|nr:hypothetical protein [Helicobacter vulpis]